MNVKYIVRLVIFIACYICVIADASQAMPQANIRWIALEGMSAKAYYAGLEFDLASQTHTYWHTPGDAGIPPSFSFKGSDNIAEVRVLWPKPSLFSEKGLRIFGYEARVTLPIEIIPRNPDLPVRLIAQLDYATCGKLCISGHAETSIIYQPSVMNAPAQKQLADWMATIPEGEGRETRMKVE